MEWDKMSRQIMLMKLYLFLELIIEWWFIYGTQMISCALMKFYFILSSIEHDTCVFNAMNMELLRSMYDDIKTFSLYIFYCYDNDNSPTIYKI